MSGSTYYQDAINAAENAGYPVDLFLQQIGVESSWNPNAVSSTGAIGLGQILPSTAANPGFGLQGLSTDQLSDPVTNLNFAAQYDEALAEATGSYAGGLQAYNVGVGNVLSGNTSGVSPAYQQLASQAAQEYGGSLDPDTQAQLAAGGNPGLDLESLLGLMPSSTAQAGATQGQQAVSSAVASAITDGIANVEGWLQSKALNVGAVIIGIVFLLIGLFMLAGGKPSDLVAVAA